jgi:serine/threonine protein kinase
VFLAIRKSDEKEVALKYIPCRDPKARDRAIREFDLSQKVRHPNKMECVDLIVQWSDDADSKNNSLLDEMDSGNLKAPASSGSNSTGGSKGSIRSLESESTGLLSGLGGSTKFVCLVMPYYPEGDLRKYTLQHIEYGRPVPSGTVLSVAIQLCDVLHYLHMLDPPIVHRDVKPENILMAENGTKVILTDFGMAVFASTNYVTTRAGTLHYAAPETWKRQFTPACDVWSLGCVLYAVATGLITKDDTRVMFDDVNDDNFETSILTDLSHLGSEVAQIILKMLQRDPDDRISAGAALEAFRGVQLENRIGETLGRIQ